MGQHVIELKKLTPENVWDLTKEDIFTLVTRLQNEPAIIQRQKYYKIIESAFVFRTISKTRKDTREELTKYGFKFFWAGNGPPVLTGVYKRRRVASVHSNEI